MNTQKEDFLQHIRTLLTHKTAPAPLPTDQEYQSARLVHNQADLTDRFIRLAREAKMEVYPVHSPDQLRNELSLLIQRLHLKTILLADDPLLASLAIQTALQTIPHLEILSPPIDTDTLVSTAFTAAAAISAAALALAETGSLVLTAASYHPRLLSVAPPVHISILPANRLLPDLLDLLNPENFTTSHLTLVSSPSKTADIEMTLVYGAHGPIEEHIFLLDN